MVVAGAESNKVQEELSNFKQTYDLLKTELEGLKLTQGEQAPKPLLGKLLNALTRA